MIKTQVSIGMIDEETLTENFKLERPASWVVRQKGFWFEILLMLCVPLPYDYYFENDDPANRVVFMKAINWIENGSVNAAHSVEYEVPYFITDFFLAFMFCSSLKRRFNRQTK